MRRGERERRSNLTGSLVLVWAVCLKLAERRGGDQQPVCGVLHRRHPPHLSPHAGHVQRSPLYYTFSPPPPPLYPMPNTSNGPLQPPSPYLSLLIRAHGCCDECKKKIWYKIYILKNDQHGLTF